MCVRVPRLRQVHKCAVLGKPERNNCCTDNALFCAGARINGKRVGINSTVQFQPQASTNLASEKVQHLTFNKTKMDFAKFVSSHWH